MRLNERGSAMSYVLVAMVLSGLVIQAILVKLDNISRQQANVQRSLDATLFVKGIENVLEHAQGCSNSLGYGYLDPAKVDTANDFDPTSRAPDEEAMQPVILRDPSGQQQVMYQAWKGDPSKDTIPPTALAYPGAVIRSLYLQRRAGAAAELASATFANDPFSPATPLAQTYDARAVMADLFVILENYGPTSSFFNRSAIRKVELTIYAMKPSSSATGWKVLTCTPNLGQANMSGWGSTTNRTTVSGMNTIACPPNQYAMSLLASAITGGYQFTVDCAGVQR